MSLEAVGTTNPGGWGSAALLQSVDALERQIFDQIEQDRHSNYVLMPLATEGEVNSGFQLFVPYFEKDNSHGAGNAWEDTAKITVAGVDGGGTKFGTDQTGLPFGSDNDTPSLANFREISMSDESVTVSYYVDGFRITKPVLRAAAMGKRMYQKGLERIVRYVSKTHEVHLQRLFFLDESEALYNVNATPASGDYFTNATATSFSEADAPMLVEPVSGGSAWGSYTNASDIPVANRLAYIRNRLERAPNYCPKFSELGNNYAAVIGADTEYYLLNFVSQVTGEATISFENESMNMAQVYKGGKLPVLFDFAMIKSHSIPIWDESLASSPGVTSNENCEINMFFGPEAIYKVPHASLMPEVHVIPPVPSVADPTGNNALVTVDFAFQAMRSPYFQEKAAIMCVPMLD